MRTVLKCKLSYPCYHCVLNTQCKKAMVGGAKVLLQYCGTCCSLSPYARGDPNLEISYLLDA